MSTRRYLSLAMTALCCLADASHRRAWAAEAPSVERTLSVFRPVQRDVEIETPAADDFKKCKITVEHAGKVSGWVVFGPNGQVLRRFMDSDGNGVVDQWRYYNHGLEVYRDIDTNNNTKPDEYRWLNTGGSRWAVDSNEDGRIDSWKSLSAEEAIRQGVTALIREDDKLLQSVLVTKDDLRSIGVSDAYAAKIMDAITDPGKKLSDVRAKSKALNAQTIWMRSDNATACAIPAEEGKLKDDLVVYENAMAIVETLGKPGLVQIGELVRIGDVWKLTQIPQPIEGAASQVSSGGVLMQPTLTAATGSAPESNAPTPEIQKLLSELQALDQASPPPAAGAAKLGEYNAKRADLLGRLVSASSTDDERKQWTRQMIDSIASAVQIGAYADGLGRLKSIEADLRKSSPKSEMIPYVNYRRLLSEYTTQHMSSNSAKQQEIQKWWREQLEKFAKDFPTADDAPEALLQLGIANEFIAKVPDAKKWYAELAERHPQAKAGRRAAGALRRLDLKGKTFEFTGPSLDGRSINARDYRGKVLLLVYWSTWCTACTDELPALRAVYEKNQSKGLEIVGVSLDVTPDPIAPFLKQHKVLWPQVYQPGGTESEPAIALGVIVPPLIVVVDRQGKVAGVTSTVEDVKTVVPELLAAEGRTAAQPAEK